MNILDNITEKTKVRVNKLKETVDFSKYKELAYNTNIEKFTFENVLKKNDISFICEIKKASPSKGIIAEDFPYLDIAKEYEAAGADAISVLTEPDFFMGNIKYLSEITSIVRTPLLRKDFIIDEIQIYEAKIAGAKAILLICSILSDEQLKNYLKIADDLGISCLTEAHDKDEIKRAISVKSRIIGVNNRDLKTFDVNIHNSIKLRKYVPQDILFVSESGIKTHEDIEELKQNNVNAVLIGETFMRAADKTKALRILKGGNCEN